MLVKDETTSKLAMKRVSLRDLLNSVAKENYVFLVYTLREILASKGTTNFDNL